MHLFSWLLSLSSTWGNKSGPVKQKSAKTNFITFETKHLFS